jgi:hypothetical protein
MNEMMMWAIAVPAAILVLSLIIFVVIDWSSR